MLIVALVDAVEPTVDVANENPVNEDGAAVAAGAGGVEDDAVVLEADEVDAEAPNENEKDAAVLLVVVDADEADDALPKAPKLNPDVEAAVVATFLLAGSSSSLAPPSAPSFSHSL